jgi:RNA polymerase sigma-70 factor (ECF subfamily)
MYNKSVNSVFFTEKFFLPLSYLYFYAIFILVNTTTYTEIDLVTGLKQHDKNAFEYLYHNYKGALLTVVKQVITDEETAGDVLQEAFVTVWKNIAKYDAAKGKLFTWLYNVTRNCAINTTRSKNFKSQQKNDSLDNYVTYADNLQGQELNINKIGLRKQVWLLREDYKNVLELSYFSGYTHEEIAKILNIPEGTVKTRLRNALIELRKQFV